MKTRRAPIPALVLLLANLACETLFRPPTITPPAPSEEPPVPAQALARASPTERPAPTASERPVPTATEVAPPAATALPAPDVPLSQTGPWGVIRAVDGVSAFKPDGKMLAALSQGNAIVLLDMSKAGYKP